jgi:ribosomal protein S18 acetylase RimI-like enzyme
MPLREKVYGGETMNAQIAPIGRGESDQLVRLFVECFKNDSYYAEMLPNSFSNTNEISEVFAEPLLYCVDHGGAYGFKDDKGLFAFILFFDYRKVKYTDRELFDKIFRTNRTDDILPYEADIHDKIDMLGGNVMYFLSLGVSERCRNRGYASRLVDFAISSHGNYFIVSDVSNGNVAKMLEKRTFSTKEITDSYYYVQRKPTVNPYGFLLDNRARLVVPHVHFSQDVWGDETLHFLKFELIGYKIVEADDVSFVKSPGERCNGYIGLVSYHQLLLYQRYINLANHTEELIEEDGTVCLIYYQRHKPSASPLWNPVLREMVQTRRQEWDIIPDVQIAIPIECRDAKRISDHANHFDPNIDAFLQYLSYRTDYESGAQVVTEGVTYTLKNRIERFYLGKLTVKITKEIELAAYDETGETIGTVADVDIILSRDVCSKCGVLTIISESVPFLISHFMDSVIRNQLLVSDGGANFVNIYEYFSEKYDICKRGTPKIFLTIPQEKSCLHEAQIASLLVSETIYASNDKLGRLTDKKLLNISSSDESMGQYDRAFVCAHTNVCIQFNPHLCGSVQTRLYEESITFLYIELLMMEESAIQIAEHNIASCLLAAKDIPPTAFLKKTLSIHNEYAKTIEFWDVQMNYPSSKISLSMIRESFKMEEQIGRMKRDMEQLQNVFDTKRAIGDRIESTILNYIVLFLTLIQGVAIVFPTLFFDTTSSVRDRILALSATFGFIILYYCFRKLISKSK